MNITDYLSDRAQKSPQAPAILRGGEAISYRELDERVWAGSTYLFGRGVRSGDTVGLLFADEFHYALCMMAAARLGATVMGLASTISAHTRDETLRQVDAGYIVTDHEACECVQSRVILWPETDLPLASDRSIADTDPAAPWLYISGSGTTGAPRIIPVTHEQMALRISLDRSVLPIGSDDRVACAMSMEFTVPKLRFFDVLSSGASYVFYDRQRQSPHTAVRTCGITVFHTTVLHAEQMLQSGHSLSSLKALLIGSSAVSDDLRERIMERLTPNLYILYGCNEASPVSVLDVRTERPVSMSVGRPVPGVTIEIVDGEDRPMPVGETGLLRLRSPGMAEGYLGDDEDARSGFRDGWFYPGDLVCLEGGLLRYRGRADHLMIYDGINIYPAEIETVMTAHESVRDAAALPIRHPVHQDVPVCAVVLKEGSDASETGLLLYARERLGVRAPREVVILDELPRNQQGKPVRAELGRRIGEALERKNAQRSRTFLVMLSGGIDSAYMLYDYLMHTDYRVHVHHISMRYPSEPRWREEDIASRQIVAFCRNIRPFDYSESRLDFGFSHYAGRDSDVQLLMASKVAPNIRGRVTLALGWLYSDHEADLRNGRAQNRVTEVLWEALLAGMDGGYAERIDREIAFPLVEGKLTKKELLVLLPKELLRLTWSCRRPVRSAEGVSRPCGQCHPCREIAAVLGER